MGVSKCLDDLLQKSPPAVIITSKLFNVMQRSWEVFSQEIATTGLFVLCAWYLNTQISTYNWCINPPPGNTWVWINHSCANLKAAANIYFDWQTLVGYYDHALGGYCFDSFQHLTHREWQSSYTEKWWNDEKLGGMGWADQKIFCQSGTSKSLGGYCAFD